MIKFLCSIFGHHYTVSKNVTSYIKEYTCANCHRQVTTDVSGNLSVLTPELRKINETLEHIHQKRQNNAERQLA